MKLTVGVKLIIGFLVTALFAAIVGTIGIVNMGKINDAADILYERELLGISFTKEANLDLIYVARDWRQALLSTTASERQKSLDDVKKNRKLFDDNIAKARPLFRSEKGKETLAKLEAAKNTWYPALDALERQMSAEPLGKASDALQTHIVDVRGKATAVDDLLTALAGMKEENGKQASEDTTELYKTSRTLMIGVILAAMALGCLIGFFTTRSITRPLNAARDAANKIAQGDMSSDIQVTSTDETGQLLAAMKEMTASIQALVADTNVLIQSAGDGRLDVRVDATKHRGSYREIITGINATLDAVVNPVNEVIQVMTAMEGGDLMQSVKGDYKGQLKDFKDTVNNTVEKLYAFSLPRHTCLNEGVARGVRFVYGSFLPQG